MVLRRHDEVVPYEHCPQTSWRFHPFSSCLPKDINLVACEGFCTLLVFTHILQPNTLLTPKEEAIAHMALKDLSLKADVQVLSVCRS